MYKDVNGKKGYRALQGHSGKVYGNFKLFSPYELSVAMADGITQIPDAPAPGPSQKQLEDRRKRAIRAEAQNRIVEHLFGSAQPGERDELLVTIEILDALTSLAVDLVQAGVLTAPQINNKLKTLRDKAVDMRQARQAAAQAIQNGDSVEDFLTALNAIIPES